jgi:hypothetical protein
MNKSYVQLRPEQQSGIPILSTLLTKVQMNAVSIVTWDCYEYVLVPHCNSRAVLPHLERQVEEPPTLMSSAFDA